MSDEELRTNLDLIKVFESARSYRASLLVQSMRLAEMEGRTEDHDRLRTEAEQVRKSFLELSDVAKGIQAEIDERKAKKDAEKPGAAPVPAATQ